MRLTFTHQQYKMFYTHIQSNRSVTFIFYSS